MLSNHLFSLLKIITSVLVSLFFSILLIVLSPFNYKGKIIHWLSKVYSKTLLLINGVKLEVIGREKIDTKRNYIYVSNHLSYFDIPVFMQAAPTDYSFIYKSSINYVPFFGWSLYVGGYIPINRENVRKALKSLQRGVKKLERGHSLIIFPEGTRSRTGEINRFKKGIFYMAQHSKAKIVPVTIIGTNKIMSPDSFRINSGKVKVIFAEPIDFEEGTEFLERLRAIINLNYNLYK